MTELNIKQLIGGNVRRLRTSAGLSQVEFGERIGAHLGRSWSAQTVSGAETGKREFIAVELVVLCQVLQCTIGELVSVDGTAHVEITSELVLSGEAIAKLSPGARYALVNASDIELAQEVLRRMQVSESAAPLTEPFDDSNNSGRDSSHAEAFMAALHYDSASDDGVTATVTPDGSPKVHFEGRSSPHPG